MVWVINLSLQANGRSATSLVRIIVVIISVGVDAGVATCRVNVASWVGILRGAGSALRRSGLRGLLAWGCFILLGAIGMVISARTPVSVRNGVCL